MIALGVNIDHIASLRELRHGIEPDIVEAATLCEKAGADSIVVHLREDRRHIQDRDVAALRKKVRTRLNLEMSIAPEIVRFCERIRPDQATLVPERRQEVTTEGGLDVTGHFPLVRNAVAGLQRHGIPVSLFIDPEKKQLEAAVRTGARRIELHTGRYAGARSSAQRLKFLRQLQQAATFAGSRGLSVFAGHGLDYDNVRRIIGIREIEELNIGYSIVCRAALVGLYRAVIQMKRLLR
ncbi:MAG: pyridoxine 5'-phosphate synthase [Candidatus Omnitrophica bacterium]|nr:pyridoxine 5'-phosphate synthase [Candidatus Omnitrophota bacterium]